MTSPYTRSPFGPAFVLGVASSGFFDGILLHQILQWHHLLSLVPGETIQRLSAQILADGLFHLVMYVVAAVGGAWLWRRRRGLDAPGGSRRLLSGLFAGFGAWNIVDVVLFHWILGIHNVRLGVPQPLLWDAGWLVVLGLAPVAVAYVVGRGGGRESGGAGRGHETVPARSAVLLALLGVAGLMAWSLRPPPPSAEVLAVFPSGASSERVMTAVAAVDGRLMRIIGDGSIVVLRLPQQGRLWTLYRHGALLVSGAAAGGCLDWSRPTPARATPA